jgi:hypothetical protein
MASYGTPNISGGNANGYLLAFAVMNVIKRQSEKVISRLNNVRLLWTLVKHRDEIKTDTTLIKTVTDIDAAFVDLRKAYDMDIDENPNYEELRSQCEIKLDAITDAVFDVILKNELITSNALAYVEMGEYGSTGETK